jgi:hypothetical protein
VTRITTQVVAPFDDSRGNSYAYQQFPVCTQVLREAVAPCGMHHEPATCEASTERCSAFRRPRKTFTEHSARCRRSRNHRHHLQLTITRRVQSIYAASRRNGSRGATWRTWCKRPLWTLRQLVNQTLRQAALADLDTYAGESAFRCTRLVRS